MGQAGASEWDQLVLLIPDIYFKDIDYNNFKSRFEHYTSQYVTFWLFS